LNIIFGFLSFVFRKDLEGKESVEVEETTQQPDAAAIDGKMCQILHLSRTDLY
jgi:hypothetical protein